MLTLCVIVINYRRPNLTIECLRSLEPDMRDHTDRCCAIIDNGSDDDSAEAIERAVAENGWTGWARMLRSPINGGFAAGNNLGMRSVEAERYMLLNSDACVTPGAIDALLDVFERRPDVGMVGPRIEGPDGRPHDSCFRFRTPISEFLRAARTGVFDRALNRFVVAANQPGASVEAQWISFACVMIRRAVVEQIGPMDEAYFMYFEDIDYSRQMRRRGWNILHEPAALVVHSKGGTSSVEAAIARRQRVPQYYYESRTRYFAKFYGGVFGVLLANGMWSLGRGVAKLRERMGNKQPHVCLHEARDNWINWLRPLRRPQAQSGGEL